MKEIIAFHQLNDFSGSPKVLANILSGLVRKGYKITLYTSSGGILDKITGIRKKEVCYRFSSSFFNTLFQFLRSNFIYFIKAFSEKRGDKIIYVNTILPFGAALGAKLKGHTIIYHYHENINAKGKFYKFLGWIMSKTADRIICVSKDQQQTLSNLDKTIVVPNAISSEYENIDIDLEKAFCNKTILMLSSLKKYKGINEFWELANELPQYKFILIINDTLENIDNYFLTNNLSTLNNLIIYPRQENVIPFYLVSSIVLNLSHKNEFIETFGLTAIEAIATGTPAIVPTVGGIAEIIEDDFNGYKIDSDNLLEIKEKICQLLSSKELYLRIARNAVSLRKNYSEQVVLNSFDKVIQEISMEN